MRHHHGRVLHHEHALHRRGRGDVFLVHQAKGVDVAGFAVEGLEAFGWAVKQEW